MKMFLTTAMLAFSMSALAQTSDMDKSQMKDGMHQSGSMKSDHMMKGKKTTMVGCIEEKDGKFMLMNKRHPDGMQLMSSEDLKAHVGHKVKVSGMMSKGDSMEGDMKSDNMKSGDMKSEDNMKSDDSMKHEKMMEHSGMMMMKVDSMAMMSEHCKMGMMSK